MFIETNPCTGFWFLLHFLPNMVCKHYESYEQLLPELQKYMPVYEKTKRYFIRTNLYKYLTENGDLERALRNRLVPMVGNNPTLSIPFHV